MKDDLLLAAAAALDDGTDPLSEWFLSEHRVSLDDAHEMAAALALGARLVVRLRAELHDGGLAATVALHRLADAVLRLPEAS